MVPALRCSVQRWLRAIVPGLVLVLVSAALADDQWHEIEPGLALGTFAAPPAMSASDGAGIHVLRVQPERFELRLLNASGSPEGRSLTARAWAALARAMDTPGADPWERRLHRAGWAMATHPELTSGRGRLDLALVRHASEPLAVKIGAMGLFCIALPRRRMGLAVKVHSGSGEALPVAVEWALAQVAPGVFARPAAWELALVRNVAGREVGRWEVAG